MLCPHCQSEIAQESKFCPECGTRISGMSSISQGGSGLMRPCPECGRENRISLTICDGCGSDVNTFLAVQDAAQKMRAYAAEKKWIPLEKEYGLLPESPRLPGEKGQNLLAEVTTLHDVVRELEACSTLVYEAKAKKDWPAVVTEADKALVQDADNAEAKTLREEAKSHLPRVPEGFRLAPGAGPEPYTDTGWAAAIIHEKSGIELVYIPAGTFTMGSPDDEGDKDCIDETALPFRVTLFEGFYLGKYEVTQAQWEKVMKKNPSGFQNAGPNAPVENVNWDDCQAFCKAAGSGLRLPMEVEWEYACRAGTKTVFHYGNSLNASKANFNGNYPYGAKKKGKYRETTIDVGQFKPNAWGLYDMHGNVCEWCQVTYQVYPKEPVTLSQPAGPTGRVDRNDPSTVLRGGSWDDPAKNCRSAYRNCWYRPDFCSNFVGLRVALSTRPIQLSRGISEERLREVRRFLDI